MVKRTLLIIILLGVVVGSLYFADLFRLNFPSPKRFPVQGIDISHHQGHIGWYEVGLHGVRFAYIKATEGTDYKDARFLYNWRQCPYNGIAHGAYHFFSFCQSGKAQARNFLETVPQDKDALPPALDLEFSGNCRRVPSRADVQREVKAFVTAIAVRYPGTPVFYATPDFYKRYLEGHRQDFPPHLLWIRNVLKEPSQAPCTEWTFWQYGSLGHIPGIHGPVDLNVFCASPEAFAQLTR